MNFLNKPWQSWPVKADRSSSDCEWGLRMLKVHYASLDLGYMRKMAKSDHATTSDKLAEWLSEVK